MSLKRSLSNLPDFYFKLNTKQKRNYRKNTRKIERNEEYKEQHPPFHASSNIDVIHIHYQSTITMIDELIIKAKQTKRYVVDTESERNKHEKQGALIQIQFIHSIHHSTIILIETNYLPNSQSILFKKIKELCAIIFSNNNEIISWGPINDEFKHFNHLDLIHIGKIVDTNLQFLFSDQYNNPNAHPERERRDDLQMYDTHDDNEITDDDYDDKYQVQNNSSQPISLQKAIATTFSKFIDKSLTVNYWQCGLDLNLNTWKNKLFSRYEYNQQIEQQQRTAMKQYAINDCTAVAELFFHMYPLKANDFQIQSTPSLASTQTTTILTPPATTSTNISFNLDDDLSNISEDDLIELLKPKFNQKEEIFHQPHHQSNELIITTTAREIYEYNQQLEQQPLPTSSSTTRLSKSEKQRQKNMKLKWKQKYHPNFQHKIKRPIYYKYGYRKIRAQLCDDNIYTSHQIAINRKYSEVVIGLKSQQELERATKIMKINYFSKNQYIERWG
ncbi:unnamed protein product [Rotaria sordida]|uniref:Uncharacterized protein n=1 Tax=Rotaria sordida TaxID=392033 RepID=A0A819ZJF4_9BILA|nr:unnamed protein product [Rotaria sordida]